MKPQTIFIKPGDTINLDGVELTYDEIKNNKIDSIIFREHLKKLAER